MRYIANTSWKRHNTNFAVKTYDRTHEVSFAGGTSIQASAAPEFLGKAELPNPEELYAASISSCFMLTFLYWAATKGLIVDEYHAEAVGTLAKNEEGKMAMTEVVLKPRIIFQNNQQPDAAVLEDLFKKAHDNCFISCSIKTKVIVQPESAVA